MGLIEWFKSVLVAAPEPVEQAAETSMREAAGVSIEREDDGWKRLTGDARRDLNPMTQRRARELAVYLWRTNPLANRLIELPVAYLLADGVQLTAAEEEAQKWLDAFWGDPINRMDIELPNMVRELALFGEQCWPAFVNEVNGHVRLGYLDPEQIETVVTDPDNIRQAIGIVTRPDKRHKKRRYRIIVNGPETVFSKSTQDIRATFDDGECFYFTINKLSNASRGHSDLLHSADWLDAYEHALFGELERWDFLRAFVWDVTLKGAQKEEVEQRARDIAPPAPGSVRVHNDSEIWEPLAPELKAADTDAAARLFRNHVLAGGTIPEHWFGGGGDVNRATAGEMGEPTVKVFTLRQRFIGHILIEVGSYVVRKRAAAVYGGDLDFAQDPTYLPVPRFPELTARDTSKFASALQSVVVAAASAVDRGLLSEQTAVALIALVAGQLGLEIDPVEELEKARADAQHRAERDGFPGMAEDPAVDGDPNAPGDDPARREAGEAA